MEAGLNAFVPPEVFPDDFHLNIDEEIAPDTDESAYAIAELDSSIMADIPSAAYQSGSESIVSVFYLNIFCKWLEDIEDKLADRRVCLTHNIASILRKASELAARQIKWKINNGDQKLKEEGVARASYQAQIVDWYLRSKGHLNLVLTESREAIIDASQDLHHDLFTFATNGILLDAAAWDHFGHSMKVVARNLRKIPDTAGSSIQHIVVSQVHTYDESTRAFIAEIRTTKFRLTKEAILIADCKSNHDKQRLKVQLISDRFEVPEHMDLKPTDLSGIYEGRPLASLMDDHFIMADGIAIRTKLVRSSKDAPLREEEPPERDGNDSSSNERKKIFEK